jgi:phosphatidylserine/phosphatidylglycerophosphate/cardiolipin synthase-like enzyme
MVEEAIRFGWIDSTLKKLHDGRLAQRLSPRRKGSNRNMSFIKYIADERSAQRDACPSKNHYKEVLSLVGKAKRMAWIGTADIKDDGMERVLCPRVHFKIIIIDSTIAYVGSANLTGAGMGMKSPRKRNFEAGILTDDPEMLEASIEQFDNVWIGKFFASSSINAVRIVAVERIVQTQ